jgi:hypothetical protein
MVSGARVVVEVKAEVNSQTGTGIGFTVVTFFGTITTFFFGTGVFAIIDFGIIDGLTRTGISEVCLGILVD